MGCLTNKCLNGQTLFEGEKLISNNGRFHLNMQRDGDLVLYKKGGKVIWASHTHNRGQGPYKAVMQKDNNFVVYDGKDVALWASKPDTKTNERHMGHARALMQSNGNFVIYSNLDSAKRPVCIFKIPLQCGVHRSEYGWARAEPRIEGSQASPGSRVHEQAQDGDFSF